MAHFELRYFAQLRSKYKGVFWRVEIAVRDYSGPSEEMEFTGRHIDMNTVVQDDRYLGAGFYINSIELDACEDSYDCELVQRMHDSFVNLCQVFCVINLNIIQSFPEGRVFSISDFAIDPQYDMALAKLLSRMSAKGEIQKIAKGKYYKPQRTPLGTLSPVTAELVKDFLEKDGLKD